MINAVIKNPIDYQKELCVKLMELQKYLEKYVDNQVMISFELNMCHVEWMLHNNLDQKHNIIDLYNNLIVCCSNKFSCLIASGTLDNSAFDVLGKNAINALSKNLYLILNAVENLEKLSKI